MFIWHEQLVNIINHLSSPFQSAIVTPRHQLLERFGRLRVTDHQLGVQEALDEPNAAFLSKVGGKLVPHHIG